MKKFWIFTVCVLLLGLGITAKKIKDLDYVNFGEYSTHDGEFEVKFWKEMFKGGGPGQPGNTLQALGQGFIFKKAKIMEGGVVGPDGEGGYTTTYVGGELILNSSGPWLNKKKLKATGITATNYSKFDNTTGHLQFSLTFGGKFDKVEVYYAVLAEYDGYPDFKYDEYGEPVFQRGYDFDVTILIDGDAIPPFEPGDPKGPTGRINYGEYTTCDPDFLTKFWKEMFKGGGPGQVGNTLKALGDGFIFKKAKLVAVTALGGDEFETTYANGVLNLNSSGPWLDSGKLRDKNVTATNHSRFDNTTGFLEFTLRFSGRFQRTGAYYSVVAWYSGYPEIKIDEYGDPVFQRGSDFHVKIKIDTVEVGPLDAGCE